MRVVQNAAHKKHNSTVLYDAYSPTMLELKILKHMCLKFNNETVISHSNSNKLLLT
jgi:hypothetical protein